MSDLILKQNQGFGVTEKYTPVTTQNLIDTLISKGYTQTALTKTKVRKSSKEGFQKHMVRLAHNDMVLRNVNDSRPEIVIVNSYDGLSSLKVMLGIFRLICSNGMIVGQTFAGFNVRHVGEIHSQIDTALLGIASKLPEISEKINLFNGLTLDASKQRDFATMAAKLVLPSQAENVNLDSVLAQRRRNDGNGSLWGVFNRAQESAIRGGIQYQTVSQNEIDKTFSVRHNTSRAIKSIDRQVEVNRALWDLTEQFAA